MFRIELDRPAGGSHRPGDEVTGRILHDETLTSGTIDVELCHVEAGELVSDHTTHDEARIEIGADDTAPTFRLRLPTSAAPAFVTMIHEQLRHNADGFGEIRRSWEVRAELRGQSERHEIEVAPAADDITAEQLAPGAEHLVLVGTPPGSRRESIVAAMIAAVIVIGAVLFAAAGTIGPGWAIIATLVAVLPGGLAVANEAGRREQTRFAYGGEALDVDRAAHRRGDLIDAHVTMTSDAETIAYLRLTETRPIRSWRPEAGSTTKQRHFELWRSDDVALLPGRNHIRLAVPADQPPTHPGPGTELSWVLHARYVEDDETPTDHHPRAIITVLP